MADRNYWGTLTYDNIISRIFDQFTRYSLAVIKYHPVLKYENDLYGTIVTDDMKEEEVKFQRGNVLGGRVVDGERLVLAGNQVYYVDRDIIVMPDAKLTLTAGTVLEFENSLGMLIQGELHSEGAETNPIKFKLKNETVDLASNASLVQLVGGADEMQGRVEIRPDLQSEWGTICNKGWDMIDASVVCQMLGLVVHPDSWSMFTEIGGDPYQPIYRSQVACTELDMDILHCKADGQQDHSCDHTMDVSVKCEKPTWAGLHFLATADVSTLRHMEVTQAGLMDPTAILYAPAVEIDYNRHTMDYINVTDCMSTGIEILHNDVYSNTKLTHATISNNLGNGVSIRSPFFELEFVNLLDNFKNGFDYNPHITTLEAQHLRAGIDSPKVFNVEETNGILIEDDGFFFVVTPEDTDFPMGTYQLEVKCARTNYFIIMDILDYNPDVTQEKIIVYDAPKTAVIPGSTFNWQIEEDIVDFPIESHGNAITIWWQVKGPTSGRFTFVVRAKPWDREYPFANVQVKNTTALRNGIGISTRHYNQPSNEYLDLFFRYRWQRIYMYGVEFNGNKERALHVPSITKYHELYMPSFEELQEEQRIAEVTYEIETCSFVNNAAGLKAEHNHIEFSNNVWIWQITNNVIENNRDGGFEIELPKVNLMFGEVFNHSVDVNDTIFEGNTNFELRIDGFYCNSSIARNRFSNNQCKLGCISITGTEKDIDIHDNEIVSNTGRYIMEFNMDSHTPYTRWVDATVMYNTFQSNKPLGVGTSHPSSSPATYTVGIKGLQNITFNRNLLQNDLDYEFLAGQESNDLENYLDVVENYWGTPDQEEIWGKIFDFDDWNSFSIAEYHPFLLYKSFDSAVTTEAKKHPSFDENGMLGGRIDGNMRLTKSGSPYIIKSDLTIMPTGSVFIEPGVEMSFYPNVGILVLGSLSAVGSEDDRIVFKPVENTQLKRWKRADDFVNSDVRLVGGETENEGFIEFYNATERKWVITCDDHFNDETAEVACRTMGFESSNVIVRRTQLYDFYVLGYPKMHEQQIEWFWRNTFICDGSEYNLEQCRYRINYQLYQCMEERQYVFVRCGARNLASNYEYWGNIRFSTPEYEQGNISPGYSIIEHADIYGAGILHEERSASIQSVYRTPLTDDVRISSCAWNGYDFIAPKDEFTVTNNDISNINGYGVGGLILNGESRDVVQSSFSPLIKNNVPYDTYGLVRMCTAEKLMYVKDRVLLYFKYDFQTVDCIKVMRSKEPQKQVGLRFLQLNLYNDSFYKNAVEFYNGEFFVPELKLGEVTSNSTAFERERIYKTDEYFDTFGIRITASAADGSFGFIAEVVTLPLSPSWQPDLGPGYRQRVSFSSMLNNQRGGFNFMNVGELNPSVVIESCRIERSGYKMLNLTSPPVMYLNVQNSQLLTVANNYIGYNGGGIFIHAETDSLATSIYSNITNNVIVNNTHGEAMHIDGHHYQRFNVRRNYFSRNYGENLNTIYFAGISVNFTSNIVWENEAATMLNVTVGEKVAVTQNFISNAIYENRAIGGNFTTIFCGTAKHKFENNFLNNWYNNFEMVTFNRTIYPETESQYPELNAQYNWWGAPDDAYIQGRIHDRKDDDNLIKVNFDNYYLSNHSIPGVVTDTKCAPGWSYWARANKCFYYYGGALTYNEARSRCMEEKGVMAQIRDRQTEVWVGELILSNQENYNEWWNVWVFRDYHYQDDCIVLRNYKLQSESNCNLLFPTVCESDPYAEPITYWKPIHIALGVIGAVFFIILILIGFAIAKYRVRKIQRLDRRNSLRASIRSSKQTVAANRSFAASSTLVPSINTPHSTLNSSKRRRPPLHQRTKSYDDDFLNLSGVTYAESSTDSINKLKLDSHRPHTPNSMLDYSTSTNLSKPSKSEGSAYFDSDLQDYHPHRLDSDIAAIMAKPSYYYDNFASSNDEDDYHTSATMPMRPQASRQVPARPRYPTNRSRQLNMSTDSESYEPRQRGTRPRPKETVM